MACDELRFIALHARSCASSLQGEPPGGDLPEKIVKGYGLGLFCKLPPNDITTDPASLFEVFIIVVVYNHVHHDIGG